MDKHFSTEAHSGLDILRCAGGLEIAAMTGMVLAAARHKLIVIVDGFISTSAAALAVATAPNVQGYLIAGHRSEEPGHQLLLDYLKLEPILTLSMRLGEGTGAVLASHAESLSFLCCSVSIRRWLPSPQRASARPLREFSPQSSEGYGLTCSPRFSSSRVFQFHRSPIRRIRWLVP